MSLVGTFSTCSICGKRRIIASQRNKVLSNQVGIDVYLECKDCASVPLWDRKTNEEKQKALEPFKALLKSKKMEVQIINKAKGETDIIIGIETKVEKTKTNDIYMPKPLDQYPTDDVYTPKQLQKMAMDQQKKSNKRLTKQLMDTARKAHRPHEKSG